MNYRSLSYMVLVLLLSAITLLFVVYRQEQQIDRLEVELQEVKMKYEIIKKDPLARDAMEAGG